MKKQFDGLDIAFGVVLVALILTGLALFFFRDPGKTTIRVECPGQSVRVVQEGGRTITECRSG